MFRSLWFKLVGALVAVVAVALIVVTLAASLAATQQFGLYTVRNGRAWAGQIAPVLAAAYAQDGDWRSAQSVLANPWPGPGVQGHFGMGPMMGPGMMRGQDMWDSMNVHLLLADAQGTIVADTRDALRGQSLPPEALRDGTPVLVGGQRVGTLVVAGSSSPIAVEATDFLFSTGRAVVLAALAAGAVSIVLGTILFSRITRPLKELESAARTVESGQLAARVGVKSKDELGMVADAFNQMTARLEKQQQIRKQMVADVAHELRTPLSVMQGTIEAMLDGVLKPNKGELRSLHGEIRRLTRLVEDLRTLSLADEGQLQMEMVELDPGTLVEQVTRAMQPLAEEHHIEMVAQVEGPLPTLRADGDRLAEVLTNLIGNALRYTPDGGHIHVRAARSADQLLVSVSDDGPGIREDDLPYVFERFWRGERSRNRASGGSGIGLAIVRQLVELHHGTIQVESAPGKGTTFRIALPIS